MAIERSEPPALSLASSYLREESRYEFLGIIRRCLASLTWRKVVQAKPDENLFGDNLDGMANIFLLENALLD